MSTSYRRRLRRRCHSRPMGPCRSCFHITYANGPLACLPWTVPAWRGQSPALQDICCLGPQAQYPLLHALTRRALEEHGGVAEQVTLCHLPWNAILRTVFTRAADLV